MLPLESLFASLVSHSVDTSVLLSEIMATNNYGYCYVYHMPFPCYCLCYVNTLEKYHLVGTSQNQMETSQEDAQSIPPAQVYMNAKYETGY